MLHLYVTFLQRWSINQFNLILAFICIIEKYLLNLRYQQKINIIRYYLLLSLSEYIGIYYRLTWDTKVRDVLGEDFYFNDGLKTSQATMKDLAAHRLGLDRRDLSNFREGVTRENAA